jgi:hypothetical protein
MKISTNKEFGLALTLALAITFHTASAQSPTFYEDIAPIIFNNCTECHRSGEIGPMNFTTYEEVFSQGSFIEYVTQSKYMPPWSPDHNYTSLVGEKYLTDDEIQLISDWVQGGMPEGDESQNPGLPEFSTGSQIGVPDLVLQMPEPYVHIGDGQEQYQVFVIPTGITETKEVKAVELRPDNSSIAHHGLIGYTTNPTSISQAIQMDENSEEPGYEAFGDYGVTVEDDLFGGWAPGSPPLLFPPTIGKVMEPGGHLLLQMHYGGSFVDQVDQTSINIFFSDDPIEREVEMYLMSPQHLNEPFYIPANEEIEFHGTLYIADDVSLISTIPHAHLLGKSWLIYATSSDLQDTIPIISIPNWDFHWQGVFTYPNMVHIPSGYTIHAIAAYDNTSSNPNNPNNPPQPMSFGDFTTDEMYVVFFQYVGYLAGDENISISDVPDNIDFVYSMDKLLPAWPNPALASSSITIGFHVATTGTSVNLDLFDLNGRRVSTWIDTESYPSGYHLVSPTLDNIPAGSYVYRLSTSTGFSDSNTLQVLGE